MSILIMNLVLYLSRILMVNFGDSRGWNKEIAESRIGASDTSPH
ncbi:MAG: hypothetical protein WAT26_16395 [Saprospiraceae bacterium]